MRKLFVVIMTLSLSQVAQAQRKHQKREFAKELSIEEAATLHSKRLTLALSLNKNQQEAIYNLEREHIQQRRDLGAKRREARAKETKPTKEERYALQNQKLDSQIAYQSKMQSILNEDQLKLWRKLRHQKSKGRKSHKRGEHSRKK